MEESAEMIERVRWAILGTAKIATEKVIPAMQKSQWTEVVGIASREIGRSREVAARFGIPRAFASYDEAISDPDVDAIYIPLPNHLHVPWSIRCAEAGKHVLCEKPISMSVKECETLIDAKNRAGVLIGEAFAVRTHPQWLRTLEVVRSGEIGQLRAITAVFSFCKDDPKNVRNILEFGGGAIMDIGCYPIKVSRLLFGEEPESVTALIDRDPIMGIDRLSSVLLDFPSGQCAFSCGIHSFLYQNVLILGTKGRIELPVPFTPSPDRNCQIILEREVDSSGGGPRVIEFELCDQYTIQADQFSLAVRGLGEVPTPLEDSVKNMAVIEAAFRSARTGQVVRLSDL